MLCRSSVPANNSGDTLNRIGDRHRMDQACIAVRRPHRLWKRSVHAALALGALAAAGSPRAGTLAVEVEQALQRNFGEYFELLRYSNVPDVPADITRNADFLGQAFE